MLAPAASPSATWPKAPRGSRCASALATRQAAYSPAIPAPSRAEPCVLTQTMRSGMSSHGWRRSLKHRPSSSSSQSVSETTASSQYLASAVQRAAGVGLLAVAVSASRAGLTPASRFTQAPLLSLLTVAADATALPLLFYPVRAGLAAEFAVGHPGTRGPSPRPSRLR